LPLFACAMPPFETLKREKVIYEVSRSAAAKIKEHLLSHASGSLRWCETENVYLLQGHAQYDCLIERRVHLSRTRARTSFHALKEEAKAPLAGRLAEQIDTLPSGEARALVHGQRRGACDARIFTHHVQASAGDGIVVDLQEIYFVSQHAAQTPVQFGQTVTVAWPAGRPDEEARAMQLRGRDNIGIDPSDDAYVRLSNKTSLELLGEWGAVARDCPFEQTVAKHFGGRARVRRLEDTFPFEPAQRMHATVLNTSDKQVVSLAGLGIALKRRRALVAIARLVRWSVR